MSSGAEDAPRIYAEDDGAMRWYLRVRRERLYVCFLLIVSNPIPFLHEHVDASTQHRKAIGRLAGAQLEHLALHSEDKGHDLKTSTGRATCKEPPYSHPIGHGEEWLPVLICFAAQGDLEAQVVVVRLRAVLDPQGCLECLPDPRTRGHVQPNSKWLIAYIGLPGGDGIRQLTEECAATL